MFVVGCGFSHLEPVIRCHGDFKLFYFTLSLQSTASMAECNLQQGLVERVARFGPCDEASRFGLRHAQLSTLRRYISHQRQRTDSDLKCDMRQMQRRPVQEDFGPFMECSRR